MTNDRSDQNPAQQSDDDEIRLISREEAEAAIGSGNAISGRKAGEYLRRAADQFPNSQDEPTRQISMSIDETGVVDLTRQENLQQSFDVGGAPTQSQAKLPNWGGSPSASGASGASDPAGSKSSVTAVQSESNWLSGLSAASGLGSKNATDEPGSAEPIVASDKNDEEPQTPSTTEALNLQSSATDPTENAVKATSPSFEGKAEQPPSSGRRFRGKPFGSDPSEPQRSFAERTQEARLSLPKRVATGLAFAIAAVAAFNAGPAWTLALVCAVLLFAAVEYFDGLRRVGFRPATALGLLAVLGTIAGAYAKGEQGLLLVGATATLFTFLWYLAGIVRQAPTANIAVTLLGILWIGVLGSFGALILRMPDRHGMTILIGAVLVTAAYDTVAYAGGVMFGRHKLAAAISPSKTWEGLAAGTVAALVMGAVVVSMMSPWSLTSALLLGLVVSVVAPLGDLAESMVKRDLGIKDMGRILPGHGGVLDRFDALLFVLPATFYLVTFLNL